MTRKVYDCFSFFNENLILELRIETLWNSVDYFVISESNRSHSGKEKPSYFDEERFRKYKSKIRRITFDAEESNLSGWILENKQRDHIIQGLYDAKPNDLILISDCDEIPNPDVLGCYDSRYLRGDFSQRYFSYAFNNELYSPKNKTDWFGTKITTFLNFDTFFGRSATSVRSFKSNGVFRSVKRSFFKFFRTQKIPDGGWHFTWIADVNGICEKVRASAHQEHLIKAHMVPEDILDLIKCGYDLQIPDRRYRIVPLDDSFPRDLVDHPERYAKFIFK